jgi:hypothetical protein
MVLQGGASGSYSTFLTLYTYPAKVGELVGGALPPPPIISNTHTAAGHVWYIKFPMYLFFSMELGLKDFEVGYNHYSGHWKGWALKISTFLGPNGTRFAYGHFRAQKGLNFQCPPLPMAHKMYVANIKIISSRPYKQQVH